MEKSRPFNAINRDLLSFKAFYFFFMSGFGSLFPYLPVYFRQVGLSASHVGLLIGLRPIIQLASAPFWAIMADKYKKRKAILIMSILAWLVMTLALAFVEPTDGICEVRAENESTSTFVNYTKIKTGFFRRSVSISAQHREEDEDMEKTNPGLVALPLKRTFLQDAYYNLSPLRHQNLTENKPNTKDLIFSATKEKGKDTRKTKDFTSTLKSNFSDGRNIFHHDTSSSSSNLYKLRPGTVQRKFNVKKRKKGENVGGFFERNKGSQSNLINRNNNTARYDVSHVQNKPIAITKTSIITTLKEHGYQSQRQRTLPRVITKKTRAPGFQGKTKKNVGFSNLNVNQRIRKSGEKGHLTKAGAGLIEANNLHSATNESSKSPETSHKAKGIVVEFSSEKVSSIKSGIDDVVSGSGDLEASGSQEGETLHIGNKRKTVKEAALTLRMQIAKSVNFFSSMADNSRRNLLHKTIAMFSHKNATNLSNAQDQTTSQLSNAFRNLMKSNQKYISGTDVSSAESSAEGSSASETKHDFTHLAHLMISQKDDLKILDSLHQENAGNSNNDVIHHNVLPDHVLPHSHTNKTAGSLGGYAQDQVASGSGVDVNSSGSSSKEVLNFNKVHKNGDFEEKAKEETTYAFSGEEKDGKTMAHENLWSQGKIEQLPSESSLDKFQMKLKNLLKSNKLEMSRIFTILLILIVVGEFLESPSFTLADASLLEILGENRRFYGRQRLWGSIGFGVFSFIVGILLERSRHVVCGEQYTDYMICFCFFGIMMLLTLFVTTSFDFHYSDVQSSSSSVLSALCNVHYGSCLLAACVMGIDFSMCHNFLTWFLEDLGASKSLMGLAVVSRAFADTITFYFAGSIIKAIGQIRVMIMVFISYTVILLTLSVLHNPWWAIPVEIMDGVTYAMAWSACTSYLAGAVPAESVTTLQGILQGVYWGLGTGSGTITGGYLIHHIGAITTFRITATFTFLVCLLFSTIQWKWTNRSINEYPQTKYTYLPTVQSKDTEALLSGYDLPRNKRNSGRIKTKFKDPY